MVGDAGSHANIYMHHHPLLDADRRFQWKSNLIGLQVHTAVTPATSGLTDTAAQSLSFKVSYSLKPMQGEIVLMRPFQDGCHLIMKQQAASDSDLALLAGLWEALLE